MTGYCFVVVVRLKPSHTFQSRGKKTPFMHVHEIKTSVAAAVAEQFCSMPVIQQREAVACLEKVACHQNVTKKIAGH